MHKQFGIQRLFPAAIIYTNFRRDLPYLGCFYDGFTREFQFRFEDKRDVGPAVVKAIEAQRQNVSVPARNFQEAITHLSKDFNDAQQAVWASEKEAR